MLAEGVARRRAAEEIAELAAARGRLVAQALDAEERARRSMSESLHDGALQDILAAGHDLWALGDAPGAEPARAMLRDVVARLRAVMVALHPTVLAYGGLDAALRAVAAQQSVAGGFEVEVDVDPAAIGQRDELLLSVARELLTNAARHARASRVELTLRSVPEGVVLEVADDGGGVPARARARGARRGPHRARHQRRARRRRRRPAGAGAAAGRRDARPRRASAAVGDSRGPEVGSYSPNGGRGTA